MQAAAAAPTVQPASAVPSSTMLRVEVSTPEPLSANATAIVVAGLSINCWLGEVMVSVGGVVSSAGT